MAQNRLAGKASCKVQSRMTSASIRNITSPRNASSDAMRDDTAAAAECAGVGRGEAVVRGATVVTLGAFYSHLVLGPLVPGPQSSVLGPGSFVWALGAGN